MSAWPKTIGSGPLAGQHFETQAAYAQAMRTHRKNNPSDGAASASGDSSPTPRVVRGRVSSARGVTREMAMGLIQVANFALAIIPQTREDQLEQFEADALAIAIVDTARANKAFAAIVQKICTVQSSASLGICVGAIVMRRVARHELLGDNSLVIGAGAEMLLYSMANGNLPTGGVDVPDTTEQPPPEPQPDPMPSPFFIAPNGVAPDGVAAG